MSSLYEKASEIIEGEDNDSVVIVVQSFLREAIIAGLFNDECDIIDLIRTRLFNADEDNLQNEVLKCCLCDFLSVVYFYQKQYTTLNDIEFILMNYKFGIDDQYNEMVVKMAMSVIQDQPQLFDDVFSLLLRCLAVNFMSLHYRKIDDNILIQIASFIVQFSGEEWFEERFINILQNDEIIISNTMRTIEFILNEFQS